MCTPWMATNWESGGKRPVATQGQALVGECRGGGRGERGRELAQRGGGEEFREAQGRRRGAGAPRLPLPSGRGARPPKRGGGKPPGRLERLDPEARGGVHTRSGGVGGAAPRKVACELGHNLEPAASGRQLCRGPLCGQGPDGGVSGSAGGLASVGRSAGRSESVGSVCGERSRVVSQSVSIRLGRSKKKPSAAAAAVDGRALRVVDLGAVLPLDLAVC